MAYPYLTPTLPDLTVLLNLRFGAVRSPSTLVRYCAHDIAAMQEQQQPCEEAAAAAAAGGRGRGSSSSSSSRARRQQQQLKNDVGGDLSTSNGSNREIWNTTIKFVGGAVSTSNGGDNRWIPLTEIYQLVVSLYMTINNFDDINLRTTVLLRLTVIL